MEALMQDPIDAGSTALPALLRVTRQTFGTAAAMQQICMFGYLVYLPPVA